MEQLNRIELRGNVGSVRLQNFEGRRVANIYMATNFAYKDKSGNAVIDTTWHNVTAWEGKNIQDVANIKKGDMLYVTGRIRIQKYSTADGTEREYPEAVATRVTPVESEDGLNYEM